MLEFGGEEDGEEDGGGGGVDVLDGGDVAEGEVRGHEGQAEGEDAEEAGEADCDDPVDVADGAAGLFGFGDENGHDDEDVCGEDGCVCRELNEEFMPVLADNTTDPRTEVVHLQAASSNVGAMMTAIWLPIRTCLAPQREAIGVALENVLRIKFFNTRRRGQATLQYTFIIQPNWFLIIGYGRASTRPRGRSLFGGIGWLLRRFSGWMALVRQAWVECDDVEQAEVAHCHGHEKAEVNDR